MFKECLSRLISLGMPSYVVAGFRYNGAVHVSTVDGIFDLLGKYSFIKDYIKKFEHRSGCLVYHAIYHEASVGRVLTLLYCSKHSSDWKSEREGLQFGELIGHVIVLERPDLAESGCVFVKKASNNALVRVR